MEKIRFMIGVLAWRKWMTPTSTFPQTKEMWSLQVPLMGGVSGEAACEISQISSVEVCFFCEKIVQIEIQTNLWWTYRGFFLVFCFFFTEEPRGTVIR